jgi:DNA-binding transcriptional MerR regulator
MLRYYDETGLLKPAEIDTFTNYRLYSIEQIPILNKIIFLRDFGFNVSEISMALNNWDNDYISKLLESKRIEIEKSIKDDQDKLLKIEMAKKDIQHEKIEINYSVSIKSIPSYQVLSLRRIVPNYYAEAQLWEEMSEFAKKNNIPVSQNNFSIFHDTDYKESDVDIEICAAVQTMGENTADYTYRKTEPIPIMACTMVPGSFDNIAGASIAFAYWLQEHNQYIMTGQRRQIVHKGPWNEQNPDN